MARQDKNGKIKGKINNIVYRGYRNQQILQGAPGKVKQTDATKLNALEFGLASTQANTIARFFKLFSLVTDGRMQVRTNGVVRRCIRSSEVPIGERDLHTGDISFLNGFSFNIDAAFEKLLSVFPKLEVCEDGAILLEIPAFDAVEGLSYPKGKKNTPHASINFVVVAFDFHKNYVQVYDTFSYDIENTSNNVIAINWECKQELYEDSIVAVGMSLRYYTKSWLNENQYIYDKDFNPNVILKAFHVTNEIAENSVKQGFDKPTGERWGLESRTKDILNEIKRFKREAEKKAKKQTKLKEFGKKQK
ncbi:hypothetical protein H8S90_16070 [Olivibacter sp. SDN3]|uniref:hypothetical protein n=1 Tax=Olivibacter sp. SDN3 TaxID=2764720 RepID=UPI001650EE28|nr:hypothetical protein [Olivibacter sp. SDN3]QNL48305.1 hypothetical protein H8S90_16070 [Olivibacter sp. SDN3]